LTYKESNLFAFYCRSSPTGKQSAARVCAVRQTGDEARCGVTPEISLGEIMKISRRCPVAGTWLRAFPVALAMLLLGSLSHAADNGPSVAAEGICMQNVFGTPVTSSNRLNCAANDIRLSRAIAVSPSTCTAGTTFDLTATFEVNVTANARYDAGFFFRIDGGPNARGTGTNATGMCSVSALKPPPPPNSPALQLDGDTCGDLNSGQYEVTFTIPGVQCVAAAGTDQLKLPNCTSWHSNAGTACQVSSPDFLASDADFFRPDTKSKCVCDDTFTVPVTVESATIDVTKTASPDSIGEPGGTVTFTVNIENLAAVEAVEIQSIVDSVFGDIGANVAGITDNTCDDLIGDSLAAGADVTCSFKAMVTGNAGDTHKDTVTVTALQPSTGDEPSASDDATVTFSDEYTAPTVLKTAQATANCRIDTTYQVVVSNNSAVDLLTLNSLTDDKFGDITAAHVAGGGFGQVVSTTCALPEDPIDPLDNMTCEFVGRIIEADCEVNHTNTVSADVTDDDGKNDTVTDDALVTGSTTP
jgi:hypothetical protein